MTRPVAGDLSSVPDSGETLGNWRQGDVALGEQWFLRAVPGKEGQDTSSEIEIDAVIDGCRGLVVVSQSCDLVSPSSRSPNVKVAALVDLPTDMYSLAHRGQMPRYVPVPTLAADRLVADLDRIMTVDKDSVSVWTRTLGCNTDWERRKFARAIARNFERPAFPDDFSPFVSKLRTRLVKKHDKKTNEGAALRALREIRVRAAPDWQAEPVDVHFWFIRDETASSFGGKDWPTWLGEWLDLLPKSGRFRAYGTVATLDDLSGSDYVESDRLDLEFLSTQDDDG